MQRVFSIISFFTLFACGTVQNTPSLNNPIQSTIAHTSKDRHLFSVEDLLNLEAVGAARLLPKRNLLVFERQRSLDKHPAFGALGSTITSARAHIYAACLEDGCYAQPLFPQSEDSASWIAGFSPSRTKLAYYTMTDGRLRIGVYEFETKTNTIFDIAPQLAVLSGFNAPLWETDDTILIGIAPEGRQTPEIWGEQGSARLVQQLRRANWDRRETTATVVSNKKPLGQSMTPPKGELVRLNTNSHAQTKLVDGVFWGAIPSPDGRYLALLQNMGREIPKGSDRTLIGPPVTKQELVIVDIQSDGQEIYRCNDCSVLKDSISWNHESTSIVFFGRRSRESWEEASYYHLDLKDNALSHLLPTHLEPPIEFGGQSFFQIYTYWLKGDPLIRARPKSGGRADWYRVNRQDTVAITRGMRSPPVKPIKVDQSEALFWGEQAIWITAGGVVKKKVELKKTNARYAPLYARRVDGAVEVMISNNNLVLSGKASDGSQKRLVAIQLNDGTVRSINQPEAHSKLLDVDLDSNLAAFLVQSQFRQAVLIQDASERTANVFRFNEHLADVLAPEIITFSYTNDNNHQLQAFLLLPANAPPGKRLPVIVVNYPWVVYSDDWFRHSSKQMWNPIPHSVHPLVGAGFAVLLPSMPMPALGEKQDMMLSFPGNILPALSAAHDLGFVDSNRAGITGISYGSYSTAGTIAQTDLFKAAVTLSHAQMDLTSFHSSLTESSRGLPDDIEPYYRWAYTEGFIHHPPWRDPDAYIRNSPIFHVESINTPWLLIQGDVDTGGGLQQAELMYAALVRAGKEAQLVRYWGEGHGIYGAGNLRDSWHRMIEWFNYYLVQHPNDER